MSVQQWQTVVEIEEMDREEKRQWLQRYAIEVLHKTPKLDIFIFLEYFVIPKSYITPYYSTSVVMDTQGTPHQDNLDAQKWSWNP